MWYWFHLKVPAVFEMVATAEQPTGPFQSLGPREVGTEDGFASDANVFRDEDGKAFLVYTDHGQNGRYAIRIDGLTDDYL
jgi:beta-xylosidase